MRMKIRETISVLFVFLNPPITAFTISNHKPNPIMQFLPKSPLRASVTSEVSNTNTDGLPNWRLLPNKDCEYKATQKISHFLHILPSQNDQDKDTKRTKNATWSKEAYESALAQYEAFVSCTDSYIEPFIQDALHTLDQSYRLYGPESVIGSFNGGKDAVVILELMRAAHANYHRNLLEESGESEEEIGRASCRERV